MIFDEHFRDHFPEAFRYLRGHFELVFHNFGEEGFLVHAFEREVASHHAKEENSYRPDICGLPKIAIPHQYFRSNVVRCAAEVNQQLVFVFELYAEAEIDDLHALVLSQENVLHLDVPVCDVLLVHEANTIEHLLYYEASSFL